MFELAVSSATTVPSERLPTANGARRPCWRPEPATDRSKLVTHWFSQGVPRYFDVFPDILGCACAFLGVPRYSRGCAFLGVPFLFSDVCVSKSSPSSFDYSKVSRDSSDTKYPQAIKKNHSYSRLFQSNVSYPVIFHMSRDSQGHSWTVSGAHCAYRHKYI